MPQTTYNFDQENRLDQFLTEHISDQSRGYIQRLIRKGLVTVNNSFKKASYSLNHGDIIQWTLFETEIKPEISSLEILFEDESILVVNKAPGVIVHPNSAQSSGTLVHKLLAYQPTIAEAIFDFQSDISQLRPGIVHRLDKNTSGALVIAKTRDALLNLSEQFNGKTVKKEYTALVFGNFSEQTHLHTGIARGEHTTGKMKVFDLGSTKRDAESVFIPEQNLFYKNNSLSLIRVAIMTGRTHQIRVHAKHLGYPIMGDALYASKTSQKISLSLGITRQMLHASTLTIKHPLRDDSLTFFANLWPDFSEAIDKCQPN